MRPVTSAPFVVDSETLLAFFDPMDTWHPDASRQMLSMLEEGRPLVLPANVICDVMTGAYMARGEEEMQRKVEGFIQELVAGVYPIDEKIAQSAAWLRAQYIDLPFSEAVVLSTAKAISADFILTCQAHWPRMDSRAMVIRPGPIDPPPSVPTGITAD